ncbi:ankyrin repeat domain-containing protein 39-like isoform X2 [Montipora capricornis]|uniref:ankyrin repeat domain-containing protein 39-like isoform X2 n=2 Tax=Montipora capricornis TaxID=246305 RepID=UPI0035F1D6C4
MLQETNLEISSPFPRAQWWRSLPCSLNDCGMADQSCEHEEACGCASKPQPCAQSFTEMDFERGIWQAALDGNMKRVRSLLDKGGDPDARDGSGYTALHYASRSGHADICLLLLERGANVNAQTRSGKATSLHRAAYSGHSEVMKILIKHGADARICDSDGQTALHKAAEKMQKDVVRILLDLDAGLREVKDRHGRIPADVAPSSLKELQSMLQIDE